MANTEKITCDYAGCDREYAYRVKGFNICAHHLGLFTEPRDAWLKRLKKLASVV